jgi:hypothetical protein
MAKIRSSRLRQTSQPVSPAPLSCSLSRPTWRHTWQKPCRQWLLLVMPFPLLFRRSAEPLPNSPAALLPRWAATTLPARTPHQCWAPLPRSALFACHVRNPCSPCDCQGPPATDPAQADGLHNSSRTPCPSSAVSPWRHFHLGHGPISTTNLLEGAPLTRLRWWASLRLIPRQPMSNAPDSRCAG